jgi:hypothetical protein
VVLAAATAAMCAVLLCARRLEPADDWTLRARLRREIDKLRKQQRLAERVALWFLLPMAPAVALLSLGGQHVRTGTYVPDARLVVYYAVCAVIYVATWWWCRREARRHYGPLLARLRRLSAELEESG